LLDSDFQEVVRELAEHSALAKFELRAAAVARNWLPEQLMERYAEV
jgi:hypothetical protein